MNMSLWENRNSGSDPNVTDWLTGEKSTEPAKIVRCIIDKDFNEGWKRLGSGDCASAVQPRREKTIGSNAVDTLRLKNHLEWKKQKEIEYLKKREAERLEEETRKEKELREEKEKRRKEKEREEKMREWQEQKAREKEERKREEMILKALEHEIKGVTQTLDKEKLIHEWIRLKNKQKQVETEKKAEMVKKEEETRALRRALAEISYRQWKERTKTRRITLPKNGYQIFGPKPAPVVKEDWNHDFIKGDTEERGVSARTPKSTVSMTSIRGSSYSRGNQSFLRQNSPNSCYPKPTRSRTSVNDLEGKLYKQLQIPEIDFEQRLKSVENFISRHEDTYFRKPNQVKSIFQENHSIKTVPNGFKSKTNAKLFNMPDMDMLPTKKKLDIYLNTDAAGEQTIKEKFNNKLSPQNNLKNYLRGLSDVNSKLLIDLNEKLSSNQIRSKSSIKASQPEMLTRSSRSCDKHKGKISGNRSSSATELDKKSKNARGLDKSETRKKKINTTDQFENSHHIQTRFKNKI